MRSEPRSALVGASQRRDTGTDTPVSPGVKGAPRCPSAGRRAGHRAPTPPSPPTRRSGRERALGTAEARRRDRDSAGRGSYPVPWVPDKSGFSTGPPFRGNTGVPCPCRAERLPARYRAETVTAAELAFEGGEKPKQTNKPQTTTGKNKQTYTKKTPTTKPAPIGRAVQRVRRSGGRASVLACAPLPRASPSGAGKAARERPETAPAESWRCATADSTGRDRDNSWAGCCTGLSARPPRAVTATGSCSSPEASRAPLPGRLPLPWFREP